MKAAFASMMTKNPVQSSHTAFQAGGNGVPILTRASGQSTQGFQNMGNSVGITNLGATRIGDQDGNANVGTPYGNGDIFTVPGQPDREYPTVHFQSVGNNVFQPDDDGKATYALLKRLGDQKFKAVSQAPFEEERARLKTASLLEEISRNAGLESLGQSRDILRHLAAERKDQNEADYLRKMLASGASPEAAQQELQNVRNANALQEAKTSDDRQYQAKSLIQRLATARGIVPSVQEPLNYSESIRNPQPSQAMSYAMGRPGEGFGTAPLDVNRISLTPGYYKPLMKRSMMSQGALDEETAFNNLLSSGEIPQASTEAYSLATLRGREREMQIDGAAESLAARLESIRQRSNRKLLPLPNTIFAKDIIDAIYNEKGRKPGDSVLTSVESIQDMSPLQLLLSINWNLQYKANGLSALKSELKKYSWGSGAKPSDTWFSDLRKVALVMNSNDLNTRLPFASVSMKFETKKLIDSIINIKNNVTPALANEVKSGHEKLFSLLEERDKIGRPGLVTKDIREMIKTMTAEEVKTIAIAQGIDDSGTKATVTKRIVGELTKK